MAPPRKPLVEAFWPKVKKTDTCWLWTGGLYTCGYGRIGGRALSQQYAHRVSLELSGVTIPVGMVVDHVCMVRHCVNPPHLRVVTRAVNNTENSNGMGAINKRKTHCKYGHEFNKENTIPIFKNGKEWRDCAICRTDRHKRNNLNRRNGNSATMA